MPTYAPTTWVDNTTPVNAANMNKVEAGIVAATGGALPADTVVAAATRIIANKLLVGDAQPVCRLMGDGKIEWGAGGATALDASLYRSAPYTLRVAEILEVNQSLAIGISNNAYLSLKSNANGIYFGAASDTNLYRSAADILKTDDQFQSASAIVGNVGTAWQTTLGGGGTSRATVYFGSANDTKIERTAAAKLATDTFTLGSLEIGATDCTLYRGAASRIDTNASLNLLYGMQLMFDGDTSLYRYSAGVLRTNSGFSAGGNIEGNAHVIVGDHIYWLAGSYDTNLYRKQANWLMTDDTFSVGQDLVIDQNNVGSRLYFGSALDTNLYRSAADTLKTDDSFQVGLVLQVNLSGSMQQTGGQFYQYAGNDLGGVALYITGDTYPRFRASNAGPFSWGPGGATPGDTNLYRHGAGALASDHTFRTRNGTTERILLTGVSGNPTILFGDASDTNLYRRQANFLMTDDQFFAAGGLVTKMVGTTPTDADIVSPDWGAILYDNGNYRLWVRTGVGWKYVQLV